MNDTSKYKPCPRCKSEQLYLALDIDLELPNDIRLSHAVVCLDCGHLEPETSSGPVPITVKGRDGKEFEVFPLQFWVRDVLGGCDFHRCGATLFRHDHEPVELTIREAERLLPFSGYSNRPAK
jgi:hypothetical protein